MRHFVHHYPALMNVNINCRCTSKQVWLMEKTQDYLKEPFYWFLLLERAEQEGDREAATKARRSLLSLGIEVRFQRRRRKPQRARPGSEGGSSR